MTDSIAPPLSSSLKFKLSVMMFLQYAIWGAWLPLLWPFLSGYRGFDGDQIGTMFAVGAVGALLAPFVAGQIADRYFATEKFLAFSHLIGAALIWQLAGIETYSGFLWFSLGYSIIYMPTLALTNSLAFHHLPDRDRDFGKVRIWGTVGWIAVGIGIGQWLLFMHTPVGADPAGTQAAQQAGMVDAFRLSSILGAAMGLFCFTLPHTPPARSVKQSALGGALSAIGRRPLVVLFLLAVPISCIHQFYFVHTAGFLGKFQSETASTLNKIVGVGGGGLMTVGQMTELGVLALVPVFAKTLSRKTFLLLGTAAYAGRMALFAFHESIPLPTEVTLILGVALHGVCFGCWIFVAFMIVDEETEGDVRASAQSLFNFVILGIGIIVGSKIAGRVAEWATIDGEMNYTRLFTVPMYAALVCLGITLLFYPSRPRASS